jgi:hypothetical protein
MMGNCCHSSSKLKSSPKSCGQDSEISEQPAAPAQSDRYLKWWGIGGVVLVVGLLWLFDGSPLFSQIITPLILMVLVLVWFVKLVAHRITGQ